ncbi:MAG: dephospho-CoA kinase [Oligoflexia bacterium]|nr:dephospho-CoA kinase [Oligoflexia bacterium]
MGLTGGIASGKSTVSKMLQDLGEVVVDADVLAREVVLPGSAGLRSVCEWFGPSVLKADGSLDRTKLRNEVFGSQDRRFLLENILHPLIQWRARQEFSYHKRRRESLVFYDAALIFEKGLVAQFGSVAVVYTKPEVQLKRLMEREKLSEEAAKSLIGAQWPLEKKKEAASVVIDNSGSVSETEKQVRAWVQSLKSP